MKYRCIWAFMTAFLIFSCAEETITIGLSLPTQKEERWVKDKKAMEEYSQKIKIRLLTRISDNNPLRQLEQCEMLLASGIRVLIVAPQDAVSGSAIAELCLRKQIPVISYDRLITHAPVDLYLSFDNEKVGELQGKYLAEHQPQGNYILLSGDPTDHNSFFYKKGAMKYLEPLIHSGSIRILADEPVKEWKQENARMIIEKVALKSPVDAILAPNDAVAGACIEYLTRTRPDLDYRITGQDAELSAVKRILAGTQNMTVFKDTRKLGEEAVRIASILAYRPEYKVKTSRTINNQYKDVPAILFEPVFIDQNNIMAALLVSGYFDAKQLKRIEGNNP